MKYIYSIIGTAQVATIKRGKITGYTNKGFNVVLTATEETQHSVLIERLKTKTFKREIKGVTIETVKNLGEPNKQALK